MIDRLFTGLALKWLMSCRSQHVDNFFERNPCTDALHKQREPGRLLQRMKLDDCSCCHRSLVQEMHLPRLPSLYSNPSFTSFLNPKTAPVASSTVSKLACHRPKLNARVRGRDTALSVEMASARARSRCRRLSKSKNIHRHRGSRLLPRTLEQVVVAGDGLVRRGFSQQVVRGGSRR